MLPDIGSDAGDADNGQYAVRKMGVTKLSGTMLAVSICWLAIGQAENTSHIDPGRSLVKDLFLDKRVFGIVLGELALIERIENVRIQAIKLLNATDAYDMVTTISDNVADILKFFGDLGPLFRNGTLATYMCKVSNVLTLSLAPHEGVPNVVSACVAPRVSFLQAARRILNAYA